MAFYYYYYYWVGQLQLQLQLLLGGSLAGTNTAPFYSLQFTGLLGQPGSLGKSTSVHNSTHVLIVICLQKTLEIQSGNPPKTHS